MEIAASYIECLKMISIIVVSGNYIFVLDLSPGFNGLGKDNCKTRGETFKFVIWRDYICLTVFYH